MSLSAEFREGVRHVCKATLFVASFVPVYLYAWAVARAVDWPKPSVMD